jgi:flavodoxin
MTRPPKALVIVSSYHHGNTEKVAAAMAHVLGAKVQRPQEVDRDLLEEYDLVGFGSGIDSDRHYAALLDLADTLPRTNSARAFIFSTCGAPVSLVGEHWPQEYSKRSHAALRERLISHGYTILGEYCCPGFNTNSFLKLFGGLNRGRPNTEDLRRAAECVRILKEQIERVGELNTM